MSVIDVTPDVTIKIEIGGGGVDAEKLSTATNLLNGETEGSLRSVAADPETDEYKLGKNATALGRSTEAPGENAFVAGWNSRARGLYSGAIGNGAAADGQAAFAANSGAAFGDYAFAIGQGTQAMGEAQHVQGRYNSLIGVDINKYAHVVGNGTAYNERSNAHTLDWNGNAWFAGDVIVGGESQDDADAKVLATQEYVDTKVGEIEIPEAPSLEGYATEKYVDDKISEIDIPSLDGYATEQYVDDKIAGIKFPDESDALDLLAEVGFVEPIAADDGTVYTDDNNVVYVL